MSNNLIEKFKAQLKDEVPLYDLEIIKINSPQEIVGLLGDNEERVEHLWMLKHKNSQCWEELEYSLEMLINSYNATKNQPFCIKYRHECYRKSLAQKLTDKFNGINKLPDTRTNEERLDDFFSGKL